MLLSLVIPAKDKNNPKLAELLRSIDAQDFPKDELEVLVITEGTSESAKAIGIRRAKGEIIGILASDSDLVGAKFLTTMYESARLNGASTPLRYMYWDNDDILNRYFALIGGNDPLSFYMGKNDKAPHYDGWTLHKWSNRTYGDNGFFVRKSWIEKTDLDNYYHIDNATEIENSPEYELIPIWHKTGGNIFKFYAKRYRYGLEHAFNPNRRWHLVDFSKPKDLRRLLWFIFATLTLIEPLSISFRGYRKIKDIAWFIHPIACIFTLVTYTFLVIHIALRKLCPLSSVRMAVQRA